MEEYPFALLLLLLLLLHSLMTCKFCILVFCHLHILHGSDFSETNKMKCFRFEFIVRVCCVLCRLVEYVCDRISAMNHIPWKFLSTLEYISDWKIQIHFFFFSNCHLPTVYEANTLHIKYVRIEYIAKVALDIDFYEKKKFFLSYNGVCVGCLIARNIPRDITVDNNIANDNLSTWIATRAEVNCKYVYTLHYVYNTC